MNSINIGNPQMKGTCYILYFHSSSCFMKRLSSKRRSSSSSLNNSFGTTHTEFPTNSTNTITKESITIKMLSNPKSKENKRSKGNSMKIIDWWTYWENGGKRGRSFWVRSWEGSTCKKKQGYGGEITILSSSLRNNPHVLII